MTGKVPPEFDIFNHPPAMQFDVQLPNGTLVKAEVFKYWDAEFNLWRVAIKDADGLYENVFRNYYTYKRYSYAHGGSASYDDFMDFFNRATVEYYRREQILKRQEFLKLGISLNPGILIANDGQMGLLPGLARVVPDFILSQPALDPDSRDSLWRGNHERNANRSVGAHVSKSR